VGVASLVLGIIGIVFAFFGAGVQWIGTIVSLVGIVLGAVARKNPEKAGIATGGLVCSIIGFVLSIILYIACVACVTSMLAANGLS